MLTEDKLKPKNICCPNFAPHCGNDRFCKVISDCWKQFKPWFHLLELRLLGRVRQIHRWFLQRRSVVLRIQFKPMVQFGDGCCCFAYVLEGL